MTRLKETVKDDQHYRFIPSSRSGIDIYIFPRGIQLQFVLRSWGCSWCSKSITLTNTTELSRRLTDTPCTHSCSSKAEVSLQQRLTLSYWLVFFHIHARDIRRSGEDPGIYCAVILRQCIFRRIALFWLIQCVVSCSVWCCQDKDIHLCQEEKKKGLRGWMSGCPLWGVHMSWGPLHLAGWNCKMYCIRDCLEQWQRGNVISERGDE